MALGVLAQHPKARVAVLAKNDVSEGSTRYAQGGIAAVLDSTDSTESHILDTLDAGAGICVESAVRAVVEGAPDAIRWLVANGVMFDREGEDLHLTREGASPSQEAA